jgi:transketolase
MRALPEVTVLAPGDLVEAECATRAVYKHQGTCYLRLGRGGEKRIHKQMPDFHIGKAIKIKDGSKVAIFSTGTIFDEAAEACEILKNQEINPALYTFPTVKPIDSKTVAEVAGQYDLIVTVEEHNVIGGFGSAVSEVLAGLFGTRARVLRIGLNDKYSSVVGSQKYLRDIYGLSARKIVEKVREKINEQCIVTG